MSEYDLDMLLKGFRIWPVGSSARATVRDILRTKYNYEMSDEEFEAPRVGDDAILKPVAQDHVAAADKRRRQKSEQNKRQARIMKATDDYLRRYERE